MEWIATPAQRNARYLDALRALKRPCECPDGCEQQRRWTVLLDGVLDAWNADQAAMGANRARPAPR